MSLNLDVVIGSPDFEVEMKSGLKTLQGSSDAVRTISETLFTGVVPERKTINGKVRTLMKANFSGSYGQIFSVEILDEVARGKFQEIGWEAYCELLSHFLNEAVYKEGNKLSAKSQHILEGLGGKADDLIRQLRISAMKHIHDTSYKFNYDVKVRFRKNRDEQFALANFNRETGATLSAKLSRREFDIQAVVTRLNINTGNGRLQLIDEEETTAFGFGTEYKLINLKAKKLLSDNLGRNNGVEPEHWVYLPLQVRPMVLRDGKVVKYLITNAYEK
jgi:hypothetical protein